MALYVVITIWLFFLLLFGLKPESILVAESWPAQPADKATQRYKTIVFVLVYLTLALLWFLTAFRSTMIGNDTKNYQFLFKIFSYGIDRSWRIELGYQYFCLFLSKLTTDQHLFLIIIATIMYGGVAVYIYKYSKNPIISLCMFFSLFFPAYTSMFRQGIAMTIALFGYQFLKQDKKLAAAFLFLFATAFHTSALVCFLLFFNLEILKNYWVVFGVTALCVLVSFSGILKVIVDTFLPRYSLYFESQYASSGWLAITYYLLSYGVLYYFTSKSLVDNDKQDRIVAANFTFMLVLTAFGYAVNLFERASEYYLLIAITEFPNMLYRGRVKHYRFWLLTICTFFLIMFILILIFRPGWNHIYPYEFWHSTDVI